ncbi:asparaginase domain-containing protein, partial [Herbaspirillum sp. B65]|uniref:asparaginase domain-containing protein n=1 Tax=Herbaspirillum sp. B65 TaxID=137708 RepID=UPI0005C8E91E
MMSSSPSDLPLCAFISTGGTIAMKIDPIRKAPVPALSGDDLLATVPAMAAIATLEVNNLFHLPSDYMDPPRWIALQQATAAALD